MKKPISYLIAMCTVATFLFLSACNSNGQKTDKATAETEQNHANGDTHEHIYSCPMHPDVRGKEGEKCPKCGMALQHMDEAATAGNFQMQFASDPQTLEAGKIVNLIFTPKNKDNPTAAVPLDVEHEKKIHLILVSKDLTWFNHLHPVFQANGTYTVPETFPSGGDYLLFADYKPSGGTNQVEKIAVNVAGNPKTPLKWTDARLTSKVDGYEVKFMNGNEMKSGIESHILISIEKGGKPIVGTDLEKYLGANAHIVMIGADEQDYLHVHPEANEFPIHAHTLISKPGFYRMWVQFQTKGTVHTADFVVKVAQGAAATEGHDQDHSGHKH